MSDEIMLPEEKEAAKKILTQMGLTDFKRYEQDIEYDLSGEYDKHKEVYDDRDIVSKPKSVTLKENAKETSRRGIRIDDVGFRPVIDSLIMRMDKDREETTNSGIILADLRPVKTDKPTGIVVKLNDDTEYDFKVGDRIIVDLRYVKHRYNNNDDIYLILDKDKVMGVYE